MLMDCISKDATETELFLLGPDALLEMAKDPRCRFTQALLQVKETINCSGELCDTLIDDDCQGIVASLGIGIALPGMSVDLETMRYGKIFVVTDESPQGLHIRSETLKFLNAYMFPLVQSGRVFVPLDKLTTEVSPSEFEERIMFPATRAHRQLVPRTSQNGQE